MPHKMAGCMTKLDGRTIRRDRPFTGNWICVEEPDPTWECDRTFRRHSKANKRIINEAIASGRSDPERWISYSRRPDHYSKSRYRNPDLTYVSVPYSIDSLAGIGMIEHDRIKPGRLGRQSRFRATPTLIDGTWGKELAYRPSEIIVLKDHEKTLMEFVDSEQTCRMRADLGRINAAIQAADIALDGKAVHDGLPLPAGDKFISAKTSLHRVFNNGSFELGGRIYGGWWQNIPKESRSRITICGEPTVELDYCHIHPTLLASDACLPLDGDPYRLFGWPRPLVKTAFNTMINAETPDSALRAVAEKIGEKGAFERARKLIADIKSEHPSMAHAFGSGAGLRLMRRDSDMAESVTLTMLAHGVVTLPIHDSFIVAKRHVELLDSVMTEVLHQATDGIYANSPSRLVSESVPQYGDQGAEPVGDQVVQSVALGDGYQRSEEEPDSSFKRAA